MLTKHPSRAVLTAASLGLAYGLALPLAEAEANADDRTSVGYLQELGKRIFFDEISRPKGKQACASCHDPSVGWTGPKKSVNLTTVAMPGAAFHKDPLAIGTLKPPTTAYASGIPTFAAGNRDKCPRGGVPANICGGVFWNGRAEGSGVSEETPMPGATESIFPEDIFVVKGKMDYDLAAAYTQFLGPLAEQALNPFPNDVEQNIEQQQVCRHVKKAPYAELFEAAWREPIVCNAKVGAGQNANNYVVAFKRIAVALAAYQSSDEVSSFSSKRDIALRSELACKAGDVDFKRYYSHAFCTSLAKKKTEDAYGKFPLVGLTDQENWGHDVFYAGGPGIPRIPNTLATYCGTGSVLPQGRGGNCAFCHTDNAGDDGTEPEQLYADDHYHNIGIPFNRMIPNSAIDGPNPGLASHTGNALHRGFHKTPTVREAAKTKGKNFVKAFGHNGWFKSLESIVHFYNTASVGGATANSFGATPIRRCEDLGILQATETEAKQNNCWPLPEVNVNTAIPFLVGNLGLNACDEAALVAYIKTLTDTREVTAPGPYVPLSMRY